MIIDVELHENEQSFKADFNENIIVNPGNVTPEQIQAAVNTYFENNPITITEEDPTVAPWAKKLKKPTYTAKEVGAATMTEVQAEIEKHLTLDSEGTV